jgi:hypothetical protein
LGVLIPPAALSSRGIEVNTAGNNNNNNNSSKITISPTNPIGNVLALFTAFVEGVYTED